MTPAELVDGVLDVLERPDLRNIAFRRLHNALRSVHGSNHYLRDIREAEVDLSVTIPADGILRLVRQDVTPNMRKIHKIETLDANGNIVDCDFKNLVSGDVAKNYFGFKYTQTYSSLGQYLNVFGISQNAVLLRIHYLSFPAYEYDSLDNEWTSDSWIMDEAPEVVEAYLFWEMSKITQEADAQQQAQMAVAQAMSELAVSYMEEVL